MINITLDNYSTFYKTKIKQHMKKFLGILAIAGVLVACDNAADSEKRIKDSTDSVQRADSARMEQEKMNTPPVIIDSPMIKLDTPKVN